MPYIYENGIAGRFKESKRNRGVTESKRIESWQICCVEKLIQCYSKQSAHKITDAASDYILQKQPLFTNASKKG